MIGDKYNDDISSKHEMAHAMGAVRANNLHHKNGLMAPDPVNDHVYPKTVQEMIFPQAENTVIPVGTAEHVGDAPVGFTKGKVK